MVTDLSFRPNIVVEDVPPFEENTWSEGDTLQFRDSIDTTTTAAAAAADQALLVSKACVRCSMVNRDPTTGGSIPDVLHSLSTCYFKQGGTVKFGRYLRVQKNSNFIQVGNHLVHASNASEKT